MGRKTFLGFALASFAGLMWRVLGRQSTADIERVLNSEGLTEQRTRELLATSLAIAVPIGSVISYWGSKVDLDGLHSWELCDGTPVRAADSPLFGKVKPALVDRFVMGCDESQDPQAQPIIGGINTIPARNEGRTGSVRLTVQQMPQHNHPHRHFIAVVAGSGERYLGDHPGQSIVTAGQRGSDSKYALASVPSVPNAGYTSTDTTEAGSGQPHEHSLPELPEQDNRPAYVGLYYIVRVK